MWQAEDHMYWNMANGYWLFAPPAGWIQPGHGGSLGEQRRAAAMAL